MNKKPFFLRQDWLAFTGLASLLVASQFVAERSREFIEQMLEAFHAWSTGWAAGVSFVVLSAVVWVAYVLTRTQPRPKTVRQAIICFVAFVVLVLSNAAPDWLSRSIGVEQASVMVRGIAFVAVVPAWIYLWHRMLPTIKEWFETPIDLAIGESSDPPAGPVTLIAIVSRINPEEVDFHSQSATVTLQRCGRSFPLTFLSMDQDIAALVDSGWSWQQLFRAVSRYSPRKDLKIILVGSKTNAKGPGSYEQLEVLCKPFLKRYPELAETEVVVLPHALDFENFNEVKDTVRGCIREESKKVGAGRVFVDITGGQKVASAAAAAATIGTMGQFQYVSTNKQCGTDDFYEVIVSDLHPQAVPAVGG